MNTNQANTNIEVLTDFMENKISSGSQNDRLNIIALMMSELVLEEMEQAFQFIQNQEKTEREKFSFTARCAVATTLAVIFNSDLGTSSKEEIAKTKH